MLVVGGRNARRVIDDRQLPAALLLRLLDAPLDVANRVEVLDQLGAIARAERALQRRRLLDHRVEDALVLLDASAPRLRIRAAAVAEQPLEHRARVVLRRQRRVRAAPGDRVGVGAGEPDVAGARRLAGLDGQLERRQLRLLPVTRAAI